MILNVIVTCFNREAYWPHLHAILKSYKTIVPRIAFCYNGENKDQASDFRVANKGIQLGEHELITGGFGLLLPHAAKWWFKLSVDSWPVDEKKLIGVIDAAEGAGAHYAGSGWDCPDELSTDIFFADTAFMKSFCGGFNGKKLEKHAFATAKKTGNYYIIPERPSGARNLPGRWSVPELGWTMSHNLNNNLEFARSYRGQ